MNKIKNTSLKTIFSYVSYMKTLKIIINSSKLQKKLDITIENYRIANEVIKYYKTNINKTPLTIIKDNNIITSKFYAKDTSVPQSGPIFDFFQPKSNTPLEIRCLLKKTENEIKNEVFKVQSEIFPISVFLTSSKKVYNEHTSSFTSLLIPEDIPLIIVGTKKGQIYFLKLNEMNEKPLYSKEEAHKDKITKIIELKSMKKSASILTTIVSSSLDTRIKIWEVTSNKELNLIATLGTSRPVQTICELTKHRMASGEREVIIWDLDNLGKFYSLENHYGSIHSLLPVDNGSQILVGSSQLKKLFIRERKNRGVVSPKIEIPTCSTDNTLGIFDIIQMDDGKIILAEDDHIKICSFDQSPSILLFGGDYVIRRICLLSDDQLISCGDYSDLQIWNIRELKLECIIITSHIKSIPEIEVRGEDIYTIGSDGKVFHIKREKNLEFNNYYYYDSIDNNAIVRFKEKNYGKVVYIKNE